MGSVHAQLLAQHPSFDLVAVADPATALAQQFAVQGFTSIEEMIDGVALDAVIVATPNHDHARSGLTAVDARLPVLLEKPVARSVVEAHRLRDAVEGATAAALVGHHRRFHPAMRRARDLIRSGELGEILAINGLWALRKADEYFEAPGRDGVLLTNLAHDVDAFRFLVGEIDGVAAHGARREGGLDSTVAATLSFECGAVGALVGSDRCPSPFGWDQATFDFPSIPQHPRGSTYTVFGTEGSLTVPDLTKYSQVTGQSWHDPLRSERLDVPHDKSAYQLQLEHFAAVVNREAEPLVTVRDACRTLEVVDQICASAFGAPLPLGHEAGASGTTTSP